MLKGNRIGFTGTRGIYAINERRLRNLELILGELYDKGYNYFHHGDCIGADEEAHKIAKKIGYKIIIHPPVSDKYRAYCKGASKTLPEGEYLERNKDIVNSVSIMLALPKDPGQEERRSGTWTAVRYAWKNMVPVTFL